MPPVMGTIQECRSGPGSHSGASSSLAFWDAPGHLGMYVYHCGFILILTYYSMVIKQLYSPVKIWLLTAVYMILYGLGSVW